MKTIRMVIGIPRDQKSGDRLKNGVFGYTVIVNFLIISVWRRSTLRGRVFRAP